MEKVNNYRRTKTCGELNSSNPHEPRDFKSLIISMRVLLILLPIFSPLFFPHFQISYFWRHRQKLLLLGKCHVYGAIKRTTIKIAIVSIYHSLMLKKWWKFEQFIELFQEWTLLNFEFMKRRRKVFAILRMEIEYKTMKIIDGFSDGE